MKNLKDLVILTLLSLLTAVPLLAQKTLVSEESKFQITFPGEWEFSQQPIGEENSGNYVYLYMHSAESGIYILALTDLGVDLADLSAEDVTAILEANQEGFTGNMGVTVTESTPFENEGVKGLYYIASNENVNTYSYALIRGNQLFQLTVVDNLSGTIDSSFFESFQFLE
jgi:hypothetical protein